MKQFCPLIILILWLTGCGQTGPLYLPPPPHTTAIPNSHTTTTTEK